MNQIDLYDILYALTAIDGREAALFGTCGPAAREAFSRSLAGEAFPELWFEIPLASEPWMDFHALTHYNDVAGKQVAFSGLSGAYDSALAWFAQQPEHTVRQIALSYDTSTGNVDTPAVQLLVDRGGLAMPLGFLEAAGRPDAKESFRTFIERMPDPWYACYVGVFPSRNTNAASPWVRVECIVGDELQSAYATDAAVLREHLAGVGLDAGVIDQVVGSIQELARSPFPLELQFNVGQDGAAAPVVSASVRFQPSDWTRAERIAVMANLMTWTQAQGLADDRWKLLGNTVFSKRASHEGQEALLSCFPAFLKLRWREGKAPDAKTYLLAHCVHE